MPRYTSYECGTGWQVTESVREWRKGGIEVRGLGAEEMG